MYCRNCGNEIKETEQFCGKCGTPVGGGKGKNTKSKKVIIIAIICILAVIVVAFLLTKNNKDAEPKNINSNTLIETEEEKQSASSILTLDDVELGTYTSLEQMNEATQRVAGIGWTYITGRTYKPYPNAKWTKVIIANKDDYGRFLVNYTFMKSVYSSEAAETESIYVWVEDINDFNKMGYYFFKPSDWGKPFTDNTEND